MAEPKQDQESKEMSPQKGGAEAVSAKAPTASLTAAQAAKLVFRAPAEPDGKSIPIKAAEVLSFRDYGTHVVVVTVDGQKFSAEKAADKAAK